jgi:uncharacterized membrane protein YozB (DUF420 family)
LKGFLGTGATFAADLNLVAQMVMGAALIVGAFLARAKKFVAHGICQASVLLLNLAMIALVMWPAFQRQVLPPLPAHLGDRYYAVATAHGLLGAGAELLGLYIVLVAGTNTVPRRLRFTRWKLWMRIGLGAWCVVLLSGIGTYYAWYIAAPAP